MFTREMEMSYSSSLARDLHLVDLANSGKRCFLIIGDTATEITGFSQESIDGAIQSRMWDGATPRYMVQGEYSPANHPFSYKAHMAMWYSVADFMGNVPDGNQVSKEVFKEDIY